MSVPDPSPVQPNLRDAPAKAPLIGYALAAGGSFLFATKGIIIKLAYGYHIGATEFLALRMIFAVPVYLVILAFVLRRAENRRLKPGAVISAIGVGLIGYWFSSWTDFKGLEYISPQFERLILFTYPLFVMGFGALFFGGKFRIGALGAFGVSYCGLLMIFLRDWKLEGDGTAIGAAFVLSAAVTFAIYQLLAKGMIAELGAPLFTCLSMIAAGVVAIGQVFISGADLHQMMKLEVLGYGALVALFATVFPSFMMTAALARISAQANSMIGIMSPVVTLGLSVAFLGSGIDWIDIAGTALVVGGIGAYTLWDRR